MTAAHIRGGITPVLLFFLFLNAAALAVGQLLFKSTAIRVGGLPFAAMVSKIAFVPSFYAACLLYAAAAMLWVWILTKLPAEHRVPVRRAFLRYGCARRLVSSGRDAFDTGLDRRSHGCRRCRPRRQFSWRKVLKPKIAPTANNAADSGETRSHRSSGVFRRRAVSWRAKPDADHLE